MVSIANAADRRRKGALAGLVGVALSLTLVGSGSPVGAADASPSQATTAEGCPTTGGTLRVAVNADSSGFLYGNDNPSLWPRSLVFLSLTRLSPDGRSVEGDAAESWEASGDYKTFTFHLRDGLKFSDGSPVTAADVVATFQAYQGNKTYAATWPDGMTISAPDDSTVVFTTAQPTALFAERWIAEQAIFPAGSDLDTMNDQPLSGGPFLLDSWQKGQLMSFKRNPNYWNQPYPCLDGVDLTVVADQNTQALQLQAGQVDFAQNLPANQVSTIKNGSSTTVATFPTWADTMIRLNEKDHPEFQDINVRQAMNYAIDKQAIIDTVYFGLGSVADSPLPRTPSYVAQTPYTYDLDKAKELMAKSAFPNGFATKLVIDPGDTVASGVAAIVKEQLAAIGIDVTIQQVDPGAQADMIQSYGYDMVYKLFSADTFDDNQYICYVMSNVCGIDAYWSGYNNPQVEALVTALNSETDPATRLDKLAQIQALVWNDADHLYIANVDGAVGLRSCVQGFVMPPTQHYYFETMYQTCGQ
jgi:peptide/nickel transport system substrate-binding protein